MAEGGADGALRVDGALLDVDRHGLGVAKGQRRRAAGDERHVQPRLQAMVLRNCTPTVNHYSLVQDSAQLVFSQQCYLVLCNVEAPRGIWIPSSAHQILARAAIDVYNITAQRA